MNTMNYVIAFNKLNVYFLISFRLAKTLELLENIVETSLFKLFYRVYLKLSISESTSLLGSTSCVRIVSARIRTTYQADQ